MHPDWPVALPVTGARLSLWRAVVVYRVATLAATLYLIGRWHDLYADAALAYGVGAGMVVVTAVVGWLAVAGRAHHPAVVGGDIAATAALTLVTIGAQTPRQRHGQMPTLTTFWAAGPALEAGLLFAALGGVLAGLVQLGAAVAVRAGADGRTVGSGLLLVVAGGVVGYVAALIVRAEAELSAASAERAAAAERERLARSIHDGVLQILGLVHRTGGAATGPWPELAAEAGRQEAALRALVTSRPDGQAAGPLDLAALLRQSAGTRATIAVPPDTVLVPARFGQEICAAIGAALDNVAQHAGDHARAWVLLERLPDQLRVTVRDDGVGFAPGRLVEAAAQGRLGVAGSIRRRVADLGGAVDIRAAPGRGTVVELAVPMPDGTQ